MGGVAGVHGRAVSAPGLSRGALRAAAPFLPAAALLAIWLLWIPFDGGYFPGAWYPAAIFTVALLCVMVVAGRRASLGSRAANVALALFAAFAAFNLLSLLWAGSRAGALEAGGQLLLYLAAAWVIALLPWRGRSASAFLGAWALGVALMCVGFLIAALGTSNVAHYVFDARWQQPTGYANTAAALPAMAFWPALMLSARRRTPRALQVLFLATAVFLLDFSLLAQSRAMFVVMLLVLPLFVLWASDRLRVLTRLVAVALASAVALNAVFGVIRAADGHHPIAPAIEHAARWIGVSVAAAALLGLGLVAIESSYRPSLGTVKVSRLAGRGIAIALLGGLLGLAVARGGSLPHYVSHEWHAFKAPPTNTGEKASYTRLGTLTSDKRYDYWRVALDAFGDHPVAGVGAGNFERVYTVRRHYPKHSRSPHDIWMRSLSETGVFGTALLAGTIVAVLVGLLTMRRRLDDDRKLIVAACVAVGAYFVGHASFDWLELMPAVGVPGVALPFLALTLSGAPPPPAIRRRGLLSISAVALSAAAIVALLAPYLSYEYTNAALANARAHPRAARRDAHRAASLNPLSPSPRYAEGVIAMGQGRYVVAERAFRRALSTERSWYPYLEFALLDARTGRFAQARAEIAQARRLNPLDPFVIAASSLIRRHRRVDPVSFNRRVLEQPLYRSQHTQ
jgi:O-Antigen ligase